MKTLHLSIIILIVGIFAMLMPNVQAIVTPFFGDLTQSYVDEQLHLHPGWIALMSTNASEDYVGPGQCSPYANLNMERGSLLYPHLKKVELNLLTPTKITENQTMAVLLRVTNNENYTLYNVTMLDWGANEFFEIGNLTTINMLEPHQSKIITGNLTFATKDEITCFHYNGGQSKPALGYQISAKNDTGKMMESDYFNSKIAVKMLSPLKQHSSGIATIDVECNQGFQLMIRNENGEPACVTQEAVNKLVDRGWGDLPLRGLPIPPVNSNQIVDVVYIQYIPPSNPGGPKIQLALMNIGMNPITSLNATLEFNNNEYTFDFKDVTESNPLTSGHSTSDTEILIGAGFTTGMAYPLAVVGTANNETFSYTLNVHIPSPNSVLQEQLRHTCTGGPGMCP